MRRWYDGRTRRRPLFPTYTYITYIALSFLFAATVLREGLIKNSAIIVDVSWVNFLVIIGIWAASLSSAMSTVLGASRILQAIARDKLLPFISIFGKGFGKTDEPRFAVLISWFLTQVNF